MDTFSWTPKLDPNGDNTFKVRTAEFGDGYSQESKEGLNNKKQTWPVSFTGYDAKIRAIRDFLDLQGGATSFLWTPPMGVQGRYKAKAYTLIPHGGGVYTLSTTFVQFFSP